MCKSKLQKQIELMKQANNMAPFPVYSTELIADYKLREKMKSKQDYDKEEVDYCTTCASLALKTVTIPSDEGEDTEIVYCKMCGNTGTSTAKNIHEWDLIYEEMHGHKFLSENAED